MISDEGWLQRWHDAGQVTVLTSRDPLAKLLLEACRTGDGVDIIYFGGSTPGSSRVIYPRRLFRAKGYDSIYVEAYCKTRGADRVFRLDKIKLSYPKYVTTPTYTTTSQPSGRTRTGTGCLIYALVTGLSVLILLAIVFGAIGR